VAAVPLLDAMTDPAQAGNPPKRATEAATQQGGFNNTINVTFAADLVMTRSVQGVPGIERVVAYCRTEKNLQAFCKKVGAEAGDTHRDPAEQDIVVTATTSRDPVLRGEWLRPGALVCAMGANQRRSRELDNVVLERAVFVCCDSIEQARLESGDLIEPVERGVLDWLEVHELQEVVVGEIAGRSSPDDIVVFKSNGIAAWDVAIRAAALARARENAVGTEL